MDPDLLEQTKAGSYLETAGFEIIDLKMSNQFPDKCKFGDVRKSYPETDRHRGYCCLAAVHRDDDKSEYQRANVDGAENVAKVCEEKGIEKIVFTSTVAIYGFVEPGTDENGVINPFNEYGKTKFAAGKAARLAVKRPKCTPHRSPYCHLW